MHTDISKLCSDFLRQHLIAIDIGRLGASHARELTAAYFGYKTHASLLAEKRFPVSDLGLAELLVPDVGTLDTRLDTLSGLPDGIPSAWELAQAITGYLKDYDVFSGKVWVTHNIDEYVQDTYLYQEDATVTDALSGEMAETNAIFDDFPQYDGIERTEDEDGLLFVVTGEIVGSIDEDRPFCGNRISIEARVSLERVAGKVAFMRPDIEAGGSLSDGWGDPEPDGPLPTQPGAVVAGSAGGHNEENDEDFSW